VNVSYPPRATGRGIARGLSGAVSLVARPLSAVNWVSFAIFAGVTYRFGW
jgi:hypothetical protein